MMVVSSAVDGNSICVPNKMGNVPLTSSATRGAISTPGILRILRDVEVKKIEVRESQLLVRQRLLWLTRARG